MSFINIDDDQRWVPTHVQVTVLRGRGLRAKGKHGTSDVYTVIQVGKEKFTTCVVEKTTAPEWTEECSFELLPGVLEVGGQGAYPPGSSDLVLTVMHRALIGPDVFLGHVVLPLEKIFQDRICLRNEWHKLRSKAGRKEKERGELQVTVQFTRHNLTASMFDLSAKDKPRSAFGKLKDRVTGKKRGEAETSSATVPGGYAVLSGGGRRLSGEDYAEDDEGRRSKVKSFFLKGKLRRSSDAQSSTSLASECSVTSSPGGTLSPAAGVGMLASDPSSSPSENGSHPAGGSPVHPAQPPPKQMTHKRAFSDEASRIQTLPRPRAVETLLAQSGALSRSSLCINGSHVYGAESLSPASASTLPASLGLLQKCAPLSRSLQNLGRRADDPRRSPGAGRRWSFDRAGKEEKAAQATAAPSSQAAQVTVTVGADLASEGKKQKRNLFSHGRSESAGKGSDNPKVERLQAQTHPEERHKGWFSAKDFHNKPSQEVSPMVETSTDALCHSTPCSSNHLPPCSSPASASPGSVYSANPFTPSPATPPISPSNPFFTRLQCNPFYEELLADQALRSNPPTPPRPSSSPLWPSAASPSWSGTPSPALNAVPQEKCIPQRERPMCMSRQRSLPALLSGTSNSSPNPFAARSLSESGCEWDESFEAFATSRLKSPRGPSHKANAGHKEWPVGGIAEEVNEANEPLVSAAKAPPLPPRRPVRTPVKEGRRDSWLDRAQELAVKKEACLLSQTDAASMLHRREGERRRNASCSSLSDREVQRAQMAKPPTEPSDSDPSPSRIQDCPSKRCPGKSAALQHHRGLTISGGDAESMVWSHGLEHGPASGAPDFDKESILNSTLEFFSLEGSDELDGGDTTSSIFGEMEDKVPSLLWEMHTNKSKISPGKARGAEPHSTATILAHGFCTANQEKSDVTTAIALEPVPNVATVHPSTNGTKVIDLEVNKQVHNKNVGDSQLAKTDSACSPPAIIDNVFEINNNTDKDFNLSQFPRLPTEVHTKKSHTLISDVFSNTAAVVSVDYDNEGSCTSFAPAPIVGSKLGVSINAAEPLVLESDLAVSTEPVEALSSELWGPPETTAEGSISSFPVSSLTEAHMENAHLGNAHTGKDFKKCFQTEWSPTEQKTDSGSPSKAWAVEMGSDSTLELPTIVFTAPCSDLNLNNTFQRNLAEELGKSNNCDHSRSLATGCPEKNEPGTISEAVVLHCSTPAEDGIIGEVTETECIHQALTSNTSDVIVLLDAKAKDGSLLNNACFLIDPLLIEPPQEGECDNEEVSEPPPKPPRIFNESMPSGHHQVNEGPKASQDALFCRKDGCSEAGVECLLSEDTQKISFEDLHAKVAPSLRNRSGIDRTSPGLPLHGSAPRASSAPSPVANSNAPSALFPLPTPIPLSVRPSAGITQAAAPSSAAPPVIGSAHTVLPQETCPATSSLSSHESSPHPVKPLTASAPQGEKKSEGRSVLVSGLEKLKSTIHPGRASQSDEPEAERNKSLSESTAQYDHLTNNEMVTLLLQREAELEKQGEEFEKQGALLVKRDVELKKMKLQVRDMEDYIDRLLVRIMEQTPTLLQVRSRFK